MKKIQGVELALKPVNMHGGGYTNFLKKIKTEADSNCLAKFIIIDLDRAINDINEERCLKELVEYCQNQNKKGAVPYFLITDNPDFEYVACLHIPDYHGENIKRYIEKKLNFTDIEKFKSNSDIYSYLNTKGNSIQLALDRLKQRSSYIRNEYTLRPKNFEIKVTKTNVNESAMGMNGSNIFELFEVIDWK